MTKRKHNYKCTLSGENYVRTSEAKNPDELVSVDSWYEMHPEKDDRPESVLLEIQKKKNQTAFDPFAMEGDNAEDEGDLDSSETDSDEKAD